LIDVNTIRQRLAQHSPSRIAEADANQAAVAAILVDSAPDDLRMLLIKRAERDDDPWSGQMAFPGGRREPQDEDLVATARRETLEETGIELLDPQLLGALDDLRPLGRGLPRIVVRPFVFLLPGTPDVSLNSEVDLHLWVGLGDLPGSAGRAPVHVNGTTTAVPAFTIGPHVVWGLTERIIRSFIELCT
jgi:8-oxo-dGTP pyrophosphatase MutT (NUDIX family)